MNFLSFRYCFRRMMEDGKKYKRAGWEGYWAWENNTIMIHCADGRVLDIRETEDVLFTIENALSEDWVVAVPSNCPVLAREMGGTQNA